jgi:hypothetical protein
VIGSLAAAQALPTPAKDLTVDADDADATAHPADVTVPAPPLPPVRRVVEGVVVTKDFVTTIVAPQDLAEFTGLTTRCAPRRTPHRPRARVRIVADARRAGALATV